jgi:glutamyl/glutaminyl-tRNA synthetase
MTSTGRFAPSATGPAHPGTLLAALLCWLDARSRGDTVWLRLEDLDPQRCSPEKTAALIEQLHWFGLDDWDGVEIQSEQHSRHDRALDQLLAAGCCYGCCCSRKDIQAVARQGSDGSWIYPGTCRGRATVAEAGEAWRFDTADEELGDPVIRRRDGAVAYLLASVVDDAAVGVDRIVRGRDLKPTTPVQNRLREALGLPLPAHRHHLLLLEAQGNKHSKFHGAVGVPELRQVMTSEALCGLLAWVAGLADSDAPCRPRDLLARFSWGAVRQEDQVLAWADGRLRWLG